MSEASERSGFDAAVAEGVLAAVGEPALVCDRDGTVRAHNDAFADIAGDAAVTGETVGALVDWADGDPVARALDGAGEATGAGRLLADGRSYTVTARPLTDDGAVGAVVTVGERAVDWSVYKAAFEASPDSVYVVDTDYRIRAVSDGFEESPLPADGVTGEPVDRLVDCGAITEETFERSREALEAVCSGEREAVSFVFEPDVAGDVVLESETAPVRRDGETVGAVTVVRDVTEREERKRELAAANERLDVALESTGAGVHVWHIGENRVYWHETTSRLFGLDPDTTERTTEAFRERVHPEDRETVREAVEEAIEGDGQVHVEYRLDERVGGNGSEDAGDREDGDVDGSRGEDVDGSGGRTRWRWMVTEGEIQYEGGEPARLVGVVRDITDRKERERELVEREQRLRAVLDSSADPIAMHDTDGRFRVVNRAMVEVVDCSREALHGARHADVFDDDTAARIEAHRRDALSTETTRVVTEQFPTTDGSCDRTVQLTVAPYYGPDERVRGTVTIARDVTELRRQRDELETLTAVQELVQESVRAVTAATTREEIQRSVCERLADSGFYEGTWVGSRDPATTEVTPDYAAGRVEEYLEEVSVRTDTAPRGRGPAGTAYRTGRVQVVEDVREDPSFEPWRDVALEYGFGTVAAAPLTHGSTTHGVLLVYTDRSGSFSERELEGFETLGAAIGFALSAAQHRRLLEADRVLELEYAVENDRWPLARASVAHDCRLVVDNATHASDGTVVSYLTVEGADPDTVSEFIADIDVVESMRRLDGDDPHFELKWTESAFHRLAEAGARGERTVVESGAGRIHVEAPADVDVRHVTEAVESRFDSVTLVARRERDQVDTPWWGAHDDVGARLTDRQRGVLQAAYYSGYYEWPRDTDAEALADSLDLATSTVLQHLRKGHRRVLEAMFDT